MLAYSSKNQDFMSSKRENLNGANTEAVDNSGKSATDYAMNDKMLKIISDSV